MTRTTAQLLATPAPHGVRLLVRQLARDVEDAHAQLGADGARGVTARHDFRVALRRLHVTLEAYADALGDSVPPRLVRRVRNLARRVGKVRDHDVRGQLLRSIAAARPARERAPITAAEDRDRDGASMEATAIVRRWHRMHRDLHAATARWTELRQLEDTPHPAPFAMAAAQALDAAAARAETRYRALGESLDRRALHSARLALKTVRYLIAPLADTLPDGDTTLVELRDAQDHLGTIHDCVLLRDDLRADVADRTPRDATPAARRARNTIEAALDARIGSAQQALAPWRNDSSRGALLAGVHAIAAHWRASVAPAVEIERKYLLSALPPRVRGLTPAVLQQGYLPGSALIERIRSVTRGRRTSWIRTVKLGKGLTRIEVEEQTPAKLGTALFALTEGRRVSKRRYTVDDGALVWEIDDFTDRTLVLAEVELPHADTPVTLPVWLEPYVVREVTDDGAFTNWRLAQ